MTDRDWVVTRDLVEVMNVERAFVLYFCVVKEEALDPGTCGRFARPRPQLVDDAGNGHELDLVGIADDDLVEQNRTGRVIVGIDESGHDCHLLGIKDLRSRADERPDILGTAHGDEPAGPDGESLRPRHKGIDRVDLGVEHDEIGILRRADLRDCGAGRPPRTNETGDASAGQAHEFSATESVSCHRTLPRTGLRVTRRQCEKKPIGIMIEQLAAIKPVPGADEDAGIPGQHEQFGRVIREANIKE